MIDENLRSSLKERVFALMEAARTVENESPVAALHNASMALGVSEALAKLIPVECNPDEAEIRRCALDLARGIYERTYCAWQRAKGV
jgi:hypothetical protein